MKNLSFEINQYKSILTLLQLLPVRSQERLRLLTLIATATGTTIYGINNYLSLSINDNALLGATVIAAGLYVEQILIHLYTTSYSNRGLSSYIGNGQQESDGCTYDVALALAPYPHDITAGFFHSMLGQHIYVRSGITKSDVVTFLKRSRTTLTAAAIPLSPQTSLSLYEVLVSILAHDTALQVWLEEIGVSPHTLCGAAHLVITELHSQKRQKRWWSRDQLSTHRTLGAYLSGAEASSHIPYTTLPLYNAEHGDEVQNGKRDELAQILGSKRGGNCLIVGTESDVLQAFVGDFAYQLSSGLALGSLLGTTLRIVDIDQLLLQNDTSEKIESALEILTTKVKEIPGAILVIHDVVTVLQRLDHFGVDTDTLLVTWFGDDGIKVIGTVYPYDIQTLRQTYPNTLTRSATIHLTAPGAYALLDILRASIFEHERQTGVIYTYLALVAIAESAIHMEGSRHEVALRLLTIVTNHHLRQGQTLIDENSTRHILTHEVGVDGDYADTTQQEIITTRVITEQLQASLVGQEKAISEIVRTLQNANLDSNSQATFLFLGSKASGTTEASRAIAAIYSSDKQACLSITSDEIDTLNEKISPVTTKVIAVTLQKEKRGSGEERCVQLLTDKIYTTSTGVKIDLTPYIIIIISDAPADLINKTTTQRKATPALDTELLRTIINRGILAKELISHADSVVLFEPLTPAQKGAVVEHTISEVAGALRAKGYQLYVEPAALDYLTSLTNVEDARHATTAILDKIIRTHIIQGQVKKGETITITRELAEAAV